MRAARAEHRLACPASKPTSNNMKPGAIVRIAGLQSEAGIKMNGRLAEVLEVDEKTGRIRVALTLDQKIKTAAIKPENLTVVLSVLDAVKQSIELEKETQDVLGRHEASFEDEFGEEIVQTRKRVPSLSLEEIIRRVREGDKVLMNALCVPGSDNRLPLSKVVALFNEHGLVEVCLEKYQFPEGVDIDSQFDTALDVPPDLCIILLANLLSGEAPGEASYDEHDLQKLKELRSDVLRRMGPSILSCCSKKRRLHGRTNLWWSVQLIFTEILYDIFIFGDHAVSVLLKELDPLVTKTLTEHVVSCMTVDPKLFLSTSLLTDGGNLLGINTKVMECIAPTIQRLAVAILMKLVDVRVVGEVLVTQIGEMVVPSGSPGLSGRRFAECFLDLSAHLALDERMPAMPSVKLLGRLKCIYTLLFKYSKLQPPLVFDYTFTSVDGDDSFRSWAKARLNLNDK